MSELLPAAETRLHDDRERRFQMPRHHAQIADQLVGLLAHNTAPREVFDDAVEQARIAQQLHRLGPLVVGHGDRLFLRCQRLLDLLVLHLFKLQAAPGPGRGADTSSLMPSSSDACFVKTLRCRAE